ncbi:FAD-dependent oxidoreductase [Mongoliimonas terrestris]|uniref:FAD-dependent oxidoreductase n=1 Tax=Mongoliimonas terrestris TaxID=1709001 RepID=UPI000949B042|nr:FAD-dependent oxidoreductase [Mongoliimonas terrestris]
MASPHVIVVGAGIGGLSVAWALARRGARVEVVDQGPIPNPLSSSHDEHRIIRHAYGFLSGYGRLAGAAYAAWETLWADIGRRHFVETGSIFTFRGDDGWAQASIAVMAETGAVIRPLPLSVLAGKAPMLTTDGLVAAYETEGDGLLFCRRILADLVVHLARLGARFHPRTRVLDVDPEACTVTTDAGVLKGDAVVAAAGAWTPRLLPAFAADLTPSRQAVMYLAPPASLAAAWDRAPVIVDFNGEAGTYTIPPRAGTRLKVGDHVFTRAGDPDGDRVATADDVARLRAAAAGAFAGFQDYTVLEEKICFYTVREDETFLAVPIGRAGYVLSACSGHGFKFGPLIGGFVAEAVFGERSGADLTAVVGGDANLLVV